MFLLMEKITYYWNISIVLLIFWIPSHLKCSHYLSVQLAHKISKIPITFKRGVFLPCMRRLCLLRCTLYPKVNFHTQNIFPMDKIYSIFWDKSIHGAKQFDFCQTGSKQQTIKTSNQIYNQMYFVTGLFLQNVHLLAHLIGGVDCLFVLTVEYMNSAKVKLFQSKKNHV